MPKSELTTPPDATSGQVDVLPPAAAEDLVLAAVREINELSRQATLDLSNQLGRVVIDRFFGGDLGAWRSRGTADASFRKLAAHPDLALSPSGLYRAVAVHELCERVDGVSGLKHLGVGHYRAVLGLPGGRQQKLLTAASEESWNVEKIEAEVARIRKANGDGRGRKPDPGFVKGIRRLGKLLEDDGGWFDELDKIDQVDEAEAEALWKTVTGMKLKCEQLQHALAVKVPGFK